ncbi:Stp1/IreP family PP2C-type Ser/Thr phosphatase [Chitinilyticum piscinae]|uniref:Stp1/IreP family PP2C-type Ser/Thr phosphatase n=1 Tax=Chitinilyticum piscinae TaxID=2866724 RepID=A0A8J7K1Q2_9NEIS|nr:Stp1/IreP family PP2C-type Ser/Thr phosphatase [Chitinilyticum piscinae]MBE9608977.1 Stp1/IreP family PP2C-type Ser/Thr phosphatase [Chitinilyticum piscinae]
MSSLAQVLDMTGLTDTGQVREHNEDAIDFDADGGLMLLADGMGGYNAGEVASLIAIQVLGEMMRAQIAATPPHVHASGSRWPVAHEMLALAVDRANTMIYQTALAHPQCAGMGTTLLAAIFYDNHVTVAHVGDSRLYRYRDGVLTQLTRDHSFLQERIDAGLLTAAEARTAPHKNLLTRAVGIAPYVDVEVQEFDVLPDDLYLACSDGLTDMLDDDSIGRLLGMLGVDLDLAARNLIDQANVMGGRDNISVLLTRVKRDFSIENPWWQRMANWFG